MDENGFFMVVDKRKNVLVTLRRQLLKPVHQNNILLAWWTNREIGLSLKNTRLMDLLSSCNLLRFACRGNGVPYGNCLGAL